MKAVELKNVTFSYDGKTKILDGVDFFADYGEVALVAGHSGEGKSTLLSIISGIIPNVNYGELSGEVFVAGQNAAGKKSGETCRRVGVVLQNADEQIVHKIAEDEIAFGCENLAFPPERIKERIKLVCGLMKLDPTSKTRSLSGGQKQRLITASTLAMGQKIIILDEPLANLDREGAARLMETLLALAKGGYCVIVVEHRLDAAMPYADCVWHIGKGKTTRIDDKSAYLSSQTNIIPDASAPHGRDGLLLKLDSVVFSVKDGDRKILRGIDCEITKGSRTVLLGENGCGKTTLMRLIARLCKPTGGVIAQYIDEKFGRKPKGSRAWFRKVGVVYQNPDYQLFMPTVRQEVAFGAKSPAYAKEIMRLFHIDALAERHPHSLSEGQKRRVSIAAVAACDPELLLLDEPTVGQDYEGLCELVSVLNRLHDESGNTMITVTHDMRCAEALCDRALLIADGVIAESGGKELIRKYFDVSPDFSVSPAG